MTEAKCLVDRITGSKREVDICLEASIAGHPVLETMNELVAKLLGFNAVVTFFESRGTAEHTHFTYRCDVAANTYFLQNTDFNRLEQVTSLEVIGTIEFDLATFLCGPAW